MQAMESGFQDEVFDIGHIRLAARLWDAPAQAPSLIALHGWMDNAASFDALAPHLQGVRLIALDLPGHGLSGHRPPGLGYHFADYLADVLQVIELLGLERYRLLGHSMGAALAALLAVVDERVESLVLIEGLGPLAGQPEDEPGRLKKALEQQVGFRDRPRRPLATPEAAAELRTRAGGISREAALQLLTRGLEPGEGGYYWRHDPRLAFKSPIYLTEEQIQAFLARITCPTQLLIGETGYLSGRRSTERRCAQVADLKVESFNANHYPHIDRAEAVAEAINGFFHQGSKDGSL